MSDMRKVPVYIERAVLRLAYDTELVRRLQKLMPDAIFQLGARCLNATNDARSLTIQKLFEAERRQP